jgi:lipase chaperone LimK
MNAATDRRAVLGSILTAGACLSVPSWAGAGALVADPLLAAIERHRRAYDAFMDAWGQTTCQIYDRANAEDARVVRQPEGGAAAELREFRELDIGRRRHSPLC